jgi:hypothetical protein
MARSNTETQGTHATTPESSEELRDVARGAESYEEPSGTLSEARKGQSMARPQVAQLEMAEGREQALEHARETMWHSTQEDALEGSSLQEEETARIADHLVFPGAGVREFREAASLGPSAEKVQDLSVEGGVPSPTDNPDRFPPAEWPPEEEDS